MYGYGGVGAGPQLGGVSGQQLEDLAALQRSTLANLPQLVGSSGQGSAAKGVRWTIFLGMLHCSDRRAEIRNARIWNSSEIGYLQTLLVRILNCL